MIEHEHPEICQADIEEAEFTKRARELLREMQKTHPLTTDPLPRAQPCQGFRATHRLEYNPRTGEYTPVPIIPQHERGD
jgi:hypothetical protein